MVALATKMALAVRFIAATMLACLSLLCVALALRAFVALPPSDVPTEHLADPPGLFPSDDARTESLSAGLSECTESLSRSRANDEALDSAGIEQCATRASALRELVALQHGLMSPAASAALIRYVRLARQVAPTELRHRQHRLELLLAVACSHNVSAANRATFEITQELASLGVSSENLQALSTCLGEALDRTELTIIHMLARRVVGRRGYDFIHVRLGVKRYTTWLRRHARQTSSFRRTRVPQGTSLWLMSYAQVRAIRSEALGEKTIEGYIGDHDFRRATLNLDRISSFVEPAPVLSGEGPASGDSPASPP